MSDHIVITPHEQRQLDVIARRLDQVAPVLNAIHRATQHVPAADRVAVQQRLLDLATHGRPLTMAIPALDEGMAA